MILRLWIPRASSIIQRAGFIVLDINRSFCFSECDLVVEVVSRDTEGFYLADRTNHNQSKLRRPTDGVTYSHSNLLLCSPSFPLFHLFDFTPFTLFTPAALTPSFGQLHGCQNVPVPIMIFRLQSKNHPGRGPSLIAWPLGKCH